MEAQIILTNTLSKKFFSLYDGALKVLVKKLKIKKISPPHRTVVKEAKKNI